MVGVDIVDCRQVDRCLEANLDGRLGGFERVALRQHLRECRACRGKVEAMSAFAAAIQRTLAVADGPDWTRLAPPTIPAPLLEPAPRPYQPRPPQEATRSVAQTARPTARSRWLARLALLVVGLVALAAFAAPTLVRGPRPVASGSNATVVASTGPAVAALTAEATRRASGRGPDYATADWQAAQSWLRLRGFSALPDLGAVEGLVLDGVALDHLDGRQVAVVLFHGPTDDVGIYLLPLLPNTTAAYGWADAAGLIALAGSWDGWQAVAASRTALPEMVRARLTAVGQP